MSAAASKSKKPQAAKPAEPEGPEPLLEAQNDRHETVMSYDHGKLPGWVIVMWATALTGFGWYVFKFLLADLSLWGSP